MLGELCVSTFCVDFVRKERNVNSHSKSLKTFLSIRQLHNLMLQNSWLYRLEACFIYYLKSFCFYIFSPRFEVQIVEERKPFAHIVCHACGEQGHKSTHCAVARRLNAEAAMRVCLFQPDCLNKVNIKYMVVKLR